MKKIVIIHFSPLELFPPVMNLLNTIRNEKDYEVHVITTESASSLTEHFKISNANLKIHRFGRSGNELAKIRRWVNFIWFYLFTTIKLIILRPKNVLYFDTLSSFPAVVYKKWICKKAKLFVHYHEYTTPDEYKKGSALLYLFHQHEKNIFSELSWFSHNNADRLSLFMKDISPITINNTQVIPNYPPKQWSTNAFSKKMNEPLRLVYIGSIGLDMMYTRQFAKWVKQMHGKVIWDIYTTKICSDVQLFFEELNAENIFLKGYKNYFQLPLTLNKYDVGIVLYKGSIQNHIYSVSNKLYEYHALGLDVWFSKNIESSLPLFTHQTYPKILALDFESLDNLQIDELINRTNHEYHLTEYSCESAFESLIHELFN